MDTTFGHLGYVSTIYTDDAFFIKKIISKPDGKILAGGAISKLITFPEASADLGVAQYLPDGTLDSTFGNNGIVREEGKDSPGQYKTEGINDMALLPSGKIAVVVDELSEVFNEADFLMYQFLPDGTADSTFGTDGMLLTDVDSLSDDHVFGIVALPDNSFVVCGSSYKFTYYPGADTFYSATSIAVIKYRPDGSFDSTFGINGKVLTLPFPNKSVYGNHIILSPDGSLFVSGSTGYSNPNQDFLVAKYHSNGTPDSSFGTAGITITDFGETDDISYSSALQPDGKIVLAGSKANNVNYNIALARYNNAIVYPLHLLAFTAIKNENTNLLQWQTAQEINTGNFEVQRSTDGKNYISIGYVKAGSSFYHFTDHKPFTSNNYYRLKMIDKNGSFMYSRIRLINNTNAFAVTIYPNPVKDKLHLKTNSDEETMVEWRITSADGKTIASGQYNAAPGSSVAEIPVASLQKGAYFISTETKHNQQIITKFMK